MKLGIRTTYSKLKTYIQLVLLLPQFYKIHIDNIPKRGLYLKVKSLVDQLRKILSRHSDFLGLIDSWKLDSEFNRIFDKASKIRGIHVTRCFMLYECLKQTSKLEGDVAEVGVHKGRSAKVVALTSEKFNKDVYLFDTFEGMPEVDLERDNFYRKGDMSDTSLAQVQKSLSDCNNITIYPGFFPDTAEPISKKTFSFVHIDVDIYRSVLDCCKFFYPRLVSRGMMVFDDPGFVRCSGAKIALDEFFTDKKEFPIYLLAAQVLVIKL